MKSLLFSALAFSLLAYPCLLSAQTTGADSLITSQKLLTIEDGLASREVFCGLQDLKGFIWLGTRNGLNRYDGKNFLLFTDQNGLQTSKILQVAVDGAGKLWIKEGNASSDMQSAGMIDILNTADNTICSLTRFFKHLPFKENEVSYIFTDGEKGVYVITFNQQLWHYFTDKGFVLITNAKPNDRAFWYTYGFGHLNGDTLALSLEQNNQWVQFADTGRRLNYFPQLTGSLKPIYRNYHYSSPLLFDRDGYCIALYRPLKGLTDLKILYKGNAPVLHKVPDALNIPLKDIATFYDGTSNTVAVQAPEGLFCYDGKQWMQILDKQIWAQHRDMAIHSYFCDATQKKWVCTSAGVYIIKSEHNRFAHYFTAQQLPALQNNQARGIFADTSGNVYANIADNLCIAAQGKANTLHVKSAHGLLYSLLNYNDTLLCSLGNCIEVYNKRKNVSHAYFYRCEIWAAYPLPKGKILLGDTYGLHVFDPFSKQMTPLLCSDTLFNRPGYYYRFLKDSKGGLWAVNEKGLYLLNDTGCIIDYYGNEAAKSSHRLPFTGLNDAYADSGGIFWLATSGDGLLKWDREKNSIRRFSRGQGFSTGTLYRIEADKNHNLWISTDYSLTRFNMVNYSAYTYTVKDGISHNEFNRTSSFKAADGRLFFGGLDGVNAFYPDDFTSDTGMLDVPLRIISFTQYDNTTGALVDKTISLMESRQIVLQPGDRFFNLEFRLLDYENEMHAYAYIIQGLDKRWNYISENSIRISGLSYGKYTLIVKGQNINGQWSIEQLKLNILVIKPFYLRGWFFALAVSLLIIFIYLFVHFRTIQLERDNIKLEKTVSIRTVELQKSLKEKESLLSEVHHRVKNNLQTIISLLDLQSRNLPDENAKNAIQEGQNRIRSIALIHQNLYQHEEFGTIEFGEFMRELAISVRDVFYKEGFDFKLVNNITKTRLDVDTALPLGLIVNELLTNSFKYAYVSGNELLVTIEIKDLARGNFILTYRDNGLGMPESFDLNKAKSLGIRLINRLTMQLGGSVMYRYEKGSVFEILFKDTAARKQEE